MKKVKKKRAPGRSKKRRRGGATLPCPKCDAFTLVRETRREPERPHEVWRRRQCRNPACRHEFTSTEKADA